MYTNKQYDIFISYRRDNGEDKARTLTQHLSALGYRVFFDHEAGMTGEFETEILAAVEIAPVFLMLLTPNCFDRCIEEGDWVRREIERAIRFKKSIIPVRPNYDESIFAFLPVGTPDCVHQLKSLEFGEIDFHKNFKATVDSMVDSMIKKVVQPSLAVSETDKKGAKIHFFSDISCRVLHYGTPIAVTDAADKTTGSIVHLLKGRHMLEYKSIENESDAYGQIYQVTDNDYEDFVNILLQPIKDKRKEEEEKTRAAEEKKAADRKKRRSRNRKAHGLDEYQYDLFFCYSRYDARIAREVYHLMQQAGYRCWIDADDLLSGGSYAQIVTERISESRCLLFFHSEHTNQSFSALKEVLFAINNNIRVLPIKLDDAPYVDFLNLDLGSIQWFVLRDREDMDRLVDTIGRILD